MTEVPFLTLEKDYSWPTKTSKEHMSHTPFSLDSFGRSWVGAVTRCFAKAPASARCIIDVDMSLYLLEHFWDKSHVGDV